MDVLVVAFIGAVIGGFSAKKKGGNGKDIAQYAAVFAVIFAVGGFVLSVIVARIMAS